MILTSLYLLILYLFSLTPLKYDGDFQMTFSKTWAALGSEAVTPADHNQQWNIISWPQTLHSLKETNKSDPRTLRHPGSSLSFTDLSLSVRSGTSLLMAFKVKSQGAVKIVETRGDVWDKGWYQSYVWRWAQKKSMPMKGWKLTFNRINLHPAPVLCTS